MRLEEHITLDAPTGEVWERVSDLPGYRRLLDGLSRWERVGEQATGSGARYLMRIHIGSADVGGLIEIVECEPQRDLAWTNVTGLDHRLRWRLRPREGGGTNVTLRFAYEAPGGLLSVVAERLAAREVSSHLRRTLANLRRLVEGDEAASEAEPGRGALAVAGDALAAARVLATAGVIRPERPERAARALARLARWGTTPAAGYAAAAARSPDAEAVVDERGAVRSGELHVRTNRIAHGLADLGVVEGDGVAIMCRNHRGFVEAIAALSKLGADALLLNTGFAGPQLVDVLKRERPRAVIYDEEFADLLGGALRGRLRIPAWTDVARPGEPTLEGLATAGDGDEPVPPARTGRVTILTSGTTGTPKGASRSSPGIGAAISILSRIPLRAQEPTLVCAPLFHSWGFAHLNLSLLLQTKLVLQRRFEPEAVLAAIERERIGCAPMVPIMLQRILDLPEATRRRYDTSSLRVVPVSGSALSGDLAVRFMDEFGDVVYNLYGSTEVAWATIATPAELRSAPGTAGRPPRGTTVRIIDEHDAEVPHGEIGRIFVGNALLFEGYTGGGTKDSVDGLMATGDVGFIDDRGRLFVSGRDDDMIVSGGENVFPREVEDLLHRHPGVMDAAVIGVEDPEWGQRLKAFVVAGDGLTEDDVRSHVGENLARYKVPRDVELLDELPRNATGKVLKRELAERPEG